MSQIYEDKYIKTYENYLKEFPLCDPYLQNYRLEKQETLVNSFSQKKGVSSLKRLEMADLACWKNEKA